MRRREEWEPIRKKQGQKVEGLDYSLDTEISLLLPYLTIMPISMQLRFLTPLKLTAQKEYITDINNTAINVLLQIAHSQQHCQSNTSVLVDLFCRLLKLDKLR
jgi:hypothetical protein